MSLQSCATTRYWKSLLVSFQLSCRHKSTAFNSCSMALS